ncbi:hypothetical protein ZIOFF_037452 [Zingiber officinale]|uniref:Cyclic nucleotide-binding domain-containing protein n=1 Tax=Zingiber officinale TaxID=94328 RepID=A0A8J5L3F2_ZINOF|nr:hypothetical protein ZIOFF_037452 [Zingiber officinale]
MPLYDCLLLAKPHVSKQALVEMVGRIGSRVFLQNGVLTDIKSFGTIQLAYGIKKLDGRHFQAAILSTSTSSTEGINSLPGGATLHHRITTEQVKDGSLLVAKPQDTCSEKSWGSEMSLLQSRERNSSSTSVQKGLVSVDPFFFYIPVIKDGNNCLYLHKKIKITASILRSFVDSFYLLRILFQFRTGFIAPSSRIFGRGVLVEDLFAIAKRYLSSYFIIDILSVLPLPQMMILIIMPKLEGIELLNATHALMRIVVLQYIPRLLRIRPLYLEFTRSAGIITETAWAGAAFNLFLYMLASHVLGASWYLLSIEREDACWRKACGRNNGCEIDSLVCRQRNTQSNNFLATDCPINSIQNPPPFDFGIYLPALNNVAQSEKFLENSLGQNLKTSTFIWENLFAIFVSTSGLVLFALLIGNMQVPMFEIMDDQLMDAMSARLKPVLFTENSCIVREGDPVNEMLFVMRGKLESTTTNGGRTGFFNSDILKAGDFCGDELLTWALDPNIHTSLPISTRTVKTLTDVEAFALLADDLKFVASQFRRLHSKKLQHTFKFHSQQWRTWAACFIQVAWRRYAKKKLEDALHEKEKLLQSVMVSDGAYSSSLGAALYASRFAANMLRGLRRNTSKARPMIFIPKPAEPDFSVEEH